MFNVKYKDCILYACIATVAFLSGARPAIAQERQFAKRGSVELGGSLSYTNSTTVSPIAELDGYSSWAFSAMPYVGYFVIDGLELGLNCPGVMLQSLSHGETLTDLTVLFAPSYNFKTNSTAYPFIEGLVGYSAEFWSSRETRSGITWGGRAGVKLAVTRRGLLSLGAQYLVVTLNTSGATQRTGYDQLSAALGFTVWF